MGRWDHEVGKGEERRSEPAKRRKIPFILSDETNRRRECQVRENGTPERHLTGKL